jgi:hypothetical protein
MEQRVFGFLLIKEAATEKVLPFRMPLKSIYNQTLALLNKKMYFGTRQRSSNNKKSIN